MLALEIALVLAFVLIVVRIRITVFVFLNLLILGCDLLGLGSVFSRILGLSLCDTRDHQTREGNTEQAASNESIQHFWSPVRNFVAHFYSTDKNTEAGRESRTLAFESYLPLWTGF